MSGSARESRAGAGDVVVVEGHHVGESRRMGEILEVLGEPGHEHFRVRWDDDRESVFYPSNDATVHRRKSARLGKSAR